MMWSYSTTQSKWAGMFFFGLLIFASCHDRSTQGSTEGETIYLQNCRLCHGADGKLALNGAKDLTLSSLGKQEIVEIVTNGKNLMQPFRMILSEKEIEKVSSYIIHLRKKNQSENISHVSGKNEVN